MSLFLSFRPCSSKVHSAANKKNLRTACRLDLFMSHAMSTLITVALAAAVGICGVHAGPTIAAETGKGKKPPPPILKRTQSGIDVEVVFEGATHIDADREFTNLSESASFAALSIPAGAVTALINPFAILAPVLGFASIPMGQAFRQQIEALTAALDPDNFGPEIAKAIEESLDTVPGIPVDAQYRFKVITYGLGASDGPPKVFDPDREVCFYVVGTLSIRPPGSQAHDKPFALVRSVGRTKGLPPPHCGRFDQFASDGEKLLRGAVKEAALMIGAWSAQQEPR